MQAKQSAPAYSGARFDINGFCITHSDVRLCRVTETGQYKIVCKTCFKCGSSALETDAHKQRTNVHGYERRASAPREVPPSHLLTAGGRNKQIIDRSFTQGRGGGDQSRVRSVPPSSRRRSIAASPNDEIATFRGRMMGVGPSTSRSKSFSRKSSCTILSSATKPKMVGQQFDSKIVDGLNKSCPKLSTESPKAKKVVHHFESKKLDGLTKSCPKFSMESPRTKTDRHPLDDNAIEALKQGILALPNSSGGEYGKHGRHVKESPLTRRNRHQVDDETNEASSGGGYGDYGHVKDSPRTDKDRHQLDNRAVNGLKQSFQALSSNSSPGSKHVDYSFVKESPFTRRNKFQVDDSTIEDLKLGILALPNRSGRKYGDSVYVKDSPRTKKDRHQFGNGAVDGLKQSFHALSTNPIPGGKHGEYGFVKESPTTEKDRSQLDDRTIETLQQCFQELRNRPGVERAHNSSKEKERPDSSSARKRVDPMSFKEGQSNKNVGRRQENIVGAEARTQNFVALPNSTARLARRSSLTRSLGRP